MLAAMRCSTMEEVLVIEGGADVLNAAPAGERVR
jgi:hypothetical protein